MTASRPRTARTPPGPRRSRNPYRWLNPRHGDRLAGLSSAARTYGVVARIPHGPVWIYLVTEPDLVKEVLVDRAEDFTVGRKLRATRHFLGDGLLGSDGELHDEQRGLLQPAFHREAVAGYVETIATRTRRSLDAWGDRAVIDLREEVTAIARDVMSTVVWGGDPGGADPVPATNELAPIVEFLEMTTTPAGRMRTRLPTGTVRRARAAAARSRAATERAIARRRAEGKGGDDVLGMLLAARDERGRPLPDALVRDQLRTILVAGQESVANTLAWTAWLVSGSENVAEGLASEAEAVLGQGLPTAEDVPRLVRARQAVQEAMRLFPPAWAVGRTAARPTVVGRWDVPAGANVLVSPWVTHRDPGVWANPQTFRPDRFAPDGDRPRHPFAYFPFGGGGRTCIGSGLAMTEATIVLAMIAREFELSWAGEAPRPCAQITLRPEGGAPVAVRVHARPESARS